MRGNSQLLRSVNSLAAQNLSMKTTVMLLLTNDNELEDAVAEALLELGGVSHLTQRCRRCAGNRLRRRLISISPLLTSNTDLME